MAGRPGKKSQQQQPPPKTYEEFEDDGDEAGDEDVGEFESQEIAPPEGCIRDWRDVEKYRERRELKKLVEDDLDEFLDDDLLSDAPSKGTPRKRRS